MMNNENYTPGNFLQFSPCIFYLLLYFSLYICTFFVHNLCNSTTTIISGLPLFTACITTVYAFFTFKKSISIREKITIFLNGSMSQSLSYFYCSFIGAAIFVHILARINSLATVINIHIICLPSHWVLPILFMIAAIISISIQSWITSIIFYMPIACGIASSLQINPALMAATIVSGIICGYQILISSTHTSNNERNKESLWLIIPASLCTLGILSMYQYQSLHPALYEYLQASLHLQD